MPKKYYLDEAGSIKAAKTVRKWTDIAFRTTPQSADEKIQVVDAVERLYRSANLTPPPRHRIVIVPSPLMARAVAGAAAWLWHCRKHIDAATRDATRAATRDATYDATDAATYAATYAATRDATYAATYDATRAATRDATYDASNSIMLACKAIAGIGGLKCAEMAYRFYQWGNEWVGSCAYAEFGRDVAKVISDNLAQKYEPWETLAKLSGHRFMHSEFCIVSDFPIEMHVNANNQLHCENGPARKWADGFAIYAFNGVRVPAEWVENRTTIDPAIILKAENVEQRAAGAALIGWPRMLSVLKEKVIDDSGSPDIGQLIELTLPGLPEPGRFLKAVCPRNGIICEGVPYVSDIDNLPINTALHAQAWRIGDPLSEYQHPPSRT
jgi:hypothetical protein